MPLYEYECLNCGNTLEALQSHNDKRLKKCPKCGENVRTIGTKRGTKVYCRHCGKDSYTTEDNPAVAKGE